VNRSPEPGTGEQTDLQRFVGKTETRCSARAECRSHVSSLRAYLDPVVSKYERKSFISRDPISVPHGFDTLRDREIIGLFAAILAWGRRDTLLRKLADLCERFDYRPYDFIKRFDRIRDAPRLEGFVHRTFNAEDASWLCLGLKRSIENYHSVEAIATDGVPAGNKTIEQNISALSGRLLAAVPEAPVRLRKHLARPETGSACKRLSMYFRWMVRSGPVDLGLWRRVKPHQLVLPLDVHTGRQARRIGLLERKTNDWKAVMELSERCRLLNPYDPCRYDFALFGTGEAGETLSLDTQSSGESSR